METDKHINRISIEVKTLEDIPREYENYLKEAKDRLSEIKSPLGNLIINSVIASTTLGIYYSLNDLLGYEPYLSGVGNRVDNVLTTTGVLSLLLIYKAKLKKEQKELEKRINYCEKSQKESENYVKKLKI